MSNDDFDSDYQNNLANDGTWKPFDIAPDLEDFVDDSEKMSALFDGLDDFGLDVELSEYTGRWMRMAEYAAVLGAWCNAAGLDDDLTAHLVKTFVDTAAKP